MPAPAAAQTPPPKPYWTSGSATPTTSTLTWAISSNAGVTKYQYRQRKQTASYPTWAAYGPWTAYGPWSDIPDSSASKMSLTLTGFDPYTAYTYQIRAVAGTVKGPASHDHIRITGGIPSLRMGASEAVITGTTMIMTVKWTIPAANAADVGKFQVRYKLSGANDWGAWTDVSGSSRSYTVTGLTNRVYRFQVRALFGTIYTNNAETSLSRRNWVPPPTQVRDVSVDTPTTPGSAIITWKKPTDVDSGSNAGCAYIAPGGDRASKHAAASIKYSYAVYNARTNARIVDAVEFSSANANLSQTRSGLPAGLLRVEVRAYSSQCERWSIPVAVQWENPLAPPTQVRDVSVDTTTTPGSAIITWKKPANIGGKRNARCAYVSEGGNQARKHAAASIKYSYAVYNARTNTRLVDTIEFTSADANLSQTRPDLPIGTGYRLRVEVRAHSSQCDKWSKPVSDRFRWENPPAPPTQPRDLAVDTTTPGPLTVTWKKPADVNNVRNAGCAYIAPGADRASRHAAASIRYRYVFYNARTDANVTNSVEFSSADANLSRAIDNLPIQTWHTLGLKVSAYSPQCERWSEPAELEFPWLGPLLCEWRRGTSMAGDPEGPLRLRCRIIPRP